MADTRRPELSPERFEALVAAYGGDIERFPERERSQARALAKRSSEARRMLEAARALDAVLVTARAEAVPRMELSARLWDIPEKYAQERPAIVALLPFRSRLSAALAAAAAVVLGVVGSGVWPDEAATPPALERAEIGSLALAGGPWDDLPLLEGGLE